MSDKKQKLYRFFYHYNRHNNKMTIHFRGKCHIVDNIKCEVPTETKWNKIQPKLVLQGYCTNVSLVVDEVGVTRKSIAYIEDKDE